MINFKMLINHLETSPLLEYSSGQVGQLLQKSRGTIYRYINHGYHTHDDEVIKLQKSGSKISTENLITFLTKVNAAQKRRHYREVV